MITDGWEFVWASYGIVYVAIGLYSVSLFKRRNALRDLAARAQAQGDEP